jgi:hypothetical protein
MFFPNHRRQPTKQEAGGDVALFAAEKFAAEDF